MLAIDVEPDGRPTGPSDPMRLDGFTSTVAWADELRDRLHQATGLPATFAWFVRMDPQIGTLAGRQDALVEAIAGELQRLREQGDTVGLHTHASRWDGVRSRWIVDHGDPAWVEHCIRTGFDAYRATFGETCGSHRFGDRWSSDAAFDLLAELGAEVDLSIEPGWRGAITLDDTSDATGTIPSYVHARSVPHRHGGGRLLILPLTAADPGPALSLPVRVARRVRFVGQPRIRPLMLERTWRGPDAYWDVMERAVGSLPVPYVAFAIRSDLVLSHRMTGVTAIFGALTDRDFARQLEFTDALTTAARLTAHPAR